MFSNPGGRRFKTSCENTNAFSTGCSLSDQHILLPINHSIYEDVWQFTQIVLKFKTAHLFLTICVNFHKSDENQSPYFGLIGDSNSKDLLETKSTKVFSVFCYINLLSWNLFFIWFLPPHETVKTQHWFYPNCIHEMNKLRFYAGTLNLSSANHPIKNSIISKTFSQKLKENYISKNYFLKMCGQSKLSLHNLKLHFGALQINFLKKCV